MCNAEEKLKRYIDESMKLMRKAAVVLPRKASAYIYHHRGVERICQTGAMFIKIVDRDYCKSYVVMQAGQAYPNHYHRIKTESMYVLYGELIIETDEGCHRLLPGEILHIERGQDHSFRTETGVVFEEISTMYVQNDSVYLDDDIRNAPYSFRRTLLNEKKWEEMLRDAEG